MNLKFVILLASLLALFVAPDFIYSAYTSTYAITSGFRAILFLIPLSCGLLLNKYRWLTAFVLVLLCVLQLIQFSRLSYFGRLMTQFDFDMILAEWQDILIGVQDAFTTHWKVLPTVIVPFILMWIVLRLQQTKNIWGTIVVAITFPIMIHEHVDNCIPYPIEGRISISNTLKSFSYYVASWFQEYHPPKYQDYAITNVGIDTDEPITIVYILGESVNINHMSLFGYERDATPNLRILSKNSNFYCTAGVSGAVCTKASLRFMTNAIYEPDNVRLNDSGETNLFKLAKENGFKTFYLASDPKNMVNSICNKSSRYIDVLITRENDKKRVTEMKDDYILELIEAQEYTKRNFIVLHQRCIHTPYAENFPKQYKYVQYFTNGVNTKIDEYDNAMKYNDTFISRVFERFNKQKNGKFYIIWASDHSEMLGEKGMFGHSIIEPEVATVPFLFQSNDEEFMKRIRSLKAIYPYAVAKMIAEIMGFTINNPNEIPDVFYANGLDYYGRSGYMKVTVKGHDLNFEKVGTK
ncbi:MAG: sulfatase-like hydrolase/transferase [Alphaproteobacteria bacterium]|nr:sulfatase-like hydrolase/transferase [Alphaproteobacteria bacterium]